MILNICLHIAYNGSQYYGFQKQTQRSRTIQGVIEQDLSIVFQKSISIVGSGRTDTGVHANGQVIHFTLNKIPFAIQKLSIILNRLLPSDVHVYKSYFVPNDFHSRFSAFARMYRYQIIHSINDFSSLHYSQLPFVHCSEKPVELKKYKRYLLPFVGENNFATFSSFRDVSKNKVRKIFHIDAYEKDKTIFIDIYANAFLRSMVRSIIGNSLDLYHKNKSPSLITEWLQSRDPNLAKKRVPAKGLCLYKVFYSKIF